MRDSKTGCWHVWVVELAKLIYNGPTDNKNLDVMEDLACDADTAIHVYWCLMDWHDADEYANGKNNLHGPGAVL